MIHLYINILFQILFPYRLLQNIEYSSLCYEVSPCRLSILYIVSFVWPLTAALLGISRKERRKERRREGKKGKRNYNIFRKRLRGGWGKNRENKRGRRK